MLLCRHMRPEKSFQPAPSDRPLSPSVRKEIATYEADRARREAEEDAEEGAEKDSDRISGFLMKSDPNKKSESNPRQSRPSQPLPKDPLNPLDIDVSHDWDAAS